MTVFIGFADRADTSLIAFTTTQVPIVGWEKRYMTTIECARLQSLDELNHLPDASTRAYQALGNAVNADVVERIALRLLKETWRQSANAASA